MKNIRITTPTLVMDDLPAKSVFFTDQINHDEEYKLLRSVQDSLKPLGVNYLKPNGYHLLNLTTSRKFPRYQEMRNFLKQIQSPFSNYNYPSIGDVNDQSESELLLSVSGPPSSILKIRMIINSLMATDIFSCLIVSEHLSDHMLRMEDEITNQFWDVQLDELSEKQKLSKANGNNGAIRSNEFYLDIDKVEILLISMLEFIHNFLLKRFGFTDQEWSTVESRKSRKVNQLGGYSPISKYFCLRVIERLDKPFVLSSSLILNICNTTVESDKFDVKDLHGMIQDQLESKAGEIFKYPFILCVKYKNVRMSSRLFKLTFKDDVYRIKGLITTENSKMVSYYFPANENKWFKQTEKGATLWTEEPCCDDAIAIYEMIELEDFN